MLAERPHRPLQDTLAGNIHQQFIPPTKAAFLIPRQEKSRQMCLHCSHRLWYSRAGSDYSPLAYVSEGKAQLALSVMRLLTYNILDAGTGRIDPLAEVIRLADADVCILQETWDAEQFHKLADRLKMDRFLAENPKNPKGAVGLLSRLPIHQAVNYAPLDAHHPAAIAAQIEIPQSSALSPQRTCPSSACTSMPGLLSPDEAIRLTEIEAILDIAKSLPPAHFLAGDFNSHHPQQHIDVASLGPAPRERIAGQKNQIPREVVSKILAAGYLDAHAIGRTPEQFGTSLTTARPNLRVRLFFVTPELAPVYQILRCLQT